MDYTKRNKIRTEIEILIERLEILQWQEKELVIKTSSISTLREEYKKSKQKEKLLKEKENKLINSITELESNERILKSDIDILSNDKNCKIIELEWINNKILLQKNSYNDLKENNQKSLDKFILENNLKRDKIKIETKRINDNMGTKSHIYNWLVHDIDVKKEELSWINSEIDYKKDEIIRISWELKEIEEVYWEKIENLITKI